MSLYYFSKQKQVHVSILPALLCRFKMEKRILSQDLILDGFTTIAEKPGSMERLNIHVIIFHFKFVPLLLFTV